MKVLTNMPAVLNYNDMKANNSKLDVTSHKLSTGKMFNNAIENPSLMGLSERNDMAIRSLKVAIENMTAGKSYYQAADTAYQEVSDTLKQMKEVLTRAKNGTYSTDDKATMSQQLIKLWSHIQTIATNATYNGDKLIDGSLSVILQVGNSDSDIFTVVAGSATVTALGLSTAGTFSITNASALANINNALLNLSDKRGGIGHASERLDNMISIVNVSVDNYTSVQSSMQDTDVASEMIKFTAQQVIQQASQAMLAQSNMRVQNLLALFR